MNEAIESFGQARAAKALPFPSLLIIALSLPSFAAAVEWLITSHIGRGAIEVDVNADLWPIPRSGQGDPGRCLRRPRGSGQDSRQADGDREAELSEKKAELEGTDPRQARRLSSFACKRVGSGLRSAAFHSVVNGMFFYGFRTGYN